VVVEDLLNNNSNIEYQSKTPSPKKEMEDIQIAPIIETSSFRINLEPYEKYYGLLEDKSRNLKEKINLAGTVVQVEKVGNTELQIRHSQPEKLNIFVYSFKLPCTYSFYNGMLNDYTLQKKLDNNIDEYKMLELSIIQKGADSFSKRLCLHEILEQLGKRVLGFIIFGTARNFP
jgi:hypothetical protein